VLAPVTSAALAMRRRYRHWWWLPGWLFAAVTLLPALLAIAWLVPGFAMLFAERLMPAPMMIIFVPLAAALCYFTMRQLPVSWPRFQPGATDIDVRAVVPASKRPDVRMDSVIATVVIAVVFALWEALRHSQQVLGNADPGVYLQYADWIARHGSAKIPQIASSFGGAGGLTFQTFGFSPNGDYLSVSGMPGLPLVLSAAVWVHGIPGALLAAPAIGGCAILSFAGLVGRLVGPRWAPVGALVLALALPEQYTGRTTLTEPLLQVLLFGGLSLIVDSMVVTRRRHGYGSVPVSSALAPMVLAGLGGFAFALTVGVWIGSLSMLLPMFPVLALMFVTRRLQAGPLAMGLFLGAAYGLLAGLVLARPYLSSLSPELHLFGLCAAGFGVVTVLVAPLGIPSARARARRVLFARVRVPRVGRLPSLFAVLQWVVFAVPALVLIGFAVRPYVLVSKGFTDPYVVRYVAMLQRLAGVTVDGHRQYYEMSLDWVVWYLGAPAVLLGCAGFCLLGRRLVRAGVSWSSAAASARVWGLVYLVLGWSLVTVLWDPGVIPAQPSASRRLVPVVLPALVLAALWACCQMKGWAGELGARRVTLWAVGVCCVLALAIPAFWSAFAPVVTLRAPVFSRNTVAFKGAAASRTYAGTYEAASSLCSAIGTNASVVFTDAMTADYFAPVVRGMCGQPAALALGAGGSGAGAGSGSGGLGSGAGSPVVEQAVAAIERAGRRPVILGASQSALSAYGAVPREVVSLQTRMDAAVLTGPPAGTWPLSVTVWMAIPANSGTA
jgi:hypothetical protein